MPVFQVEANGKKYEVEAPDVNTAVSAIEGMGKPDVGRADAFGQGAAQGATLGWSDELQGTLSAGGRGEREPASLGTFLKGAYRLATGAPDARTNYEAGRNTARTASETAQTQRPGWYLGGQLAGGIASTAPLAPLTTGATAAATVGRGIVGGAGLGGIQGAGEAKEAKDIGGDALTGALVGGAVGGAVPAALQGARRLVSPSTVDNPTRQGLVAALQGEGIDLSAGQQTGSKAIRYLESAANDMPFTGGGIDDLMTRQKEQFTGAAMRRMGETADRATPDVIDRALTRMGNEFDRLAANNSAQVDQPFVQDLMRVAQDYGALVPNSQQAPVVGGLLQDVMQRARTGQIDGQFYQAARSRIDRMARNARADPQLQDALSGIRTALDDVMERSLSGPDAAAWREVRQQYRNMIPIRQASIGAGESAAEGLLSPAALYNAVKQQNRNGAARGQGDLTELARAGVGVMTPLPNSGTAPRMMAQGMLTGLAPALIGGGVGGASSGDTSGALAGALVGAGLSRAALSRVGQTYLANQGLAGPGGANRRLLEALLAAPARQQAVAHPVGPNGGQ